MVILTISVSAWFSVCYVAIIYLTIGYNSLSILVIPVESCWLRWSWLRFDYNLTTVKCDNCGYSVEVEDATKRYRLPLFFIFLGTAVLAFQHVVSKPSLIITILGVQSALIGVIWLVVVRFRSGRDWWRNCLRNN